MLQSMSRFAVLALLIACGNGSKTPGDQQAHPEGGGGAATTERIAVPGAGAEGMNGAARGAPEAAAKGADPTKLTEATKRRAENPAFHLKPEEGTLTIVKAETTPGAPATAEIKLDPGTGYKVATDYPTKVWLEDTTGVKLDKTYLTAGGRNKSQGDAATLSEQSLVFAVQATPETAGSYEIHGVFTFGICEKDSCHPRTQPITIQVAAN